MSENKSDAARNNYIDLLRFLFCMIIFIHHSGHVTRGSVTLLPSGGLVADAFFMLSGYYAVKHLSRVFANKDESAGSEYVKLTGHPMGYSIRYTLNKLLKALPYVAFGTVIIYILELVIMLLTGTPITLVDITTRIRDMIIELTYLPLTGIMGPIDPMNYRNTPMWFLSAMLIALPLIMYLAIKCKDAFKNYIIWFIPPMLQGWMVVKFGGVLPWQNFVGPVNSGIIRGFSSLLMGAGIYYASKALQKNKSAFTKPVIATIIELLVFVLFIINVIRGVSGYEELFSLYLVAITLAYALSGITYTARISWAPLEFLGRISLPIYCLHWGIYRWVAAAFGEKIDYLSAIAVTFILCLVSSIVIMYVVKIIDLKRCGMKE